MIKKTVKARMMLNCANRSTLKTLLSALLLAASTTTYAGVDEMEDNRTPLVIDFITATYLPAQKGVLVAGLHGLLGSLEISAAGEGTLKKFASDEKIDFTTVERLSDSEVLLGTSIGKIYSFDGSKLTELAKITEFDEPVLDIAISGGKAWAVGARGMLAKSDDGKKWDIVTIEEIDQPEIKLPATNASDWYFGVSNLIAESVKLTANKGGKPVVVDTDYTLYPDEGFIQIANDLDAEPAPAISFKFKPGPAFKLGDVSWNVVMFEGESVTLAGEFGMIVQSRDGGKTWVRRDAVLTAKEPEPPYWITGTQQGNTMMLVGAAGAVHRSTDAGSTWTRLPVPSAEGLFGVTLLADGTPAIAGAVGMIGVYQNDKWTLADRSKLELLSWLKTPVAMPDGSTLMMGGRQTVIQYKDGNWTRVTIK